MLNISEQKNENACVIAIKGELVASTLDIVKSKVKELVAAGSTAITFDMTESDAIDSAGIGFIAAAHNTLVKSGGALKLVGLSKDMYDFFVCLRMNTHFTIETRDK